MRRPAPAAGERYAARVKLQALALGLAASLVVLAFWWALAEVEGVAVDLLMRLRGPGPADPRVAIVAIDEESIDRYGRWPWRRDRVAELVTRLDRAGARVIALDILFSEPSRRDEVVDLSAEDEALTAAFERAGNVVLGYFFRTGSARPPDDDSSELPDLPILQAGGDLSRSAVPPRAAVEENLPALAAAAAGQGFYDQEPESGVHRHYQLVARYRGFHYPSLALAAVALFEGEGPEISLPDGVPEIRLGKQRIETNERGRLWINYRSRTGSFEQISAARVLAGELPAGVLADRLVFVGFTEAGLGEIFTSPWGSPMTGVEVHAHVADNLLNDRYIRDRGVEAGWSILAALLLGPLVSLLVVATPGRPAGALAAVALVLLWPAASYLAFARGGWHLHVTAPVAAGLLALVGQVAFEGRSRWVRRTFQQFVSSEVVREMLEHPERVRLGGESRELTVLFCDVRGFTALSETREPQQVVEILNRFFTPMTAVVIGNGGTLDKYMGDALMAFFGAPVRQQDHAARACRAALAMCRELERVKVEAAAADPLPPGFGVGVGLNTGVMTVGNMGSDQIFDYTVIGDPVNLGSRVEGLTRVYGVDIVVTSFTREAAGEAFLFRELDRVRVKGRREPVTIYELLDDPELGPLVRGFEAGLALYRDRRFEAAAAAFEEVLADRPGDGPARVFLARARQLAADPPEPGWDGVFERTTK